MCLGRAIMMMACLAGVGASLAAPQSLQVADNQVKIAVMGQEDFHPDRAVPGNIRSLPDDLAARVIEHLNNTRRFSVVERTALRRVVREQGFGGEQSGSDLDSVIEKTVENLPATHGWTIAAAATAADHNDRLSDFQNLGSSLGADYIVYAVLEKHQGSSRTQGIPFSDSAQTLSKKQVEARLRLRVIESKLGRIVGADSIRTRISESVFAGREAVQDTYSMFDHLGEEAAIRVLDMIFPARLVGSAPWVINRGSNENLESGAQFQIVREGKEIVDDVGIVIGRLNQPVGMAEVSQVQETLAVLTALSGEFAINDLAIRQRSPAASDQPVLTKAPLVKTPAEETVAAKPRLAVGLIKAHSTATTGVDANKHIPAFTDTLISRLSQTRRFQLIDRQEVDQLLTEQLAQAMTENRDLPSSMGALAGADYVVIGSIANFAVEQVKLKLPGSARVITSHQGRVEGNMRIVNARSGEVLDSRKVSILEELAEPESVDLLFTRLSDAYADQTVINLMNAIFPIKIAAVVSGVVYVNRGADGGLSQGEVLTAIRPGQAIVDPDTGVQLGVAETELGQITLLEVEDARSKATQGQLQLRTGDILKRQHGARSRRSGVASSIAAPARSGGVVGNTAATPLTLAVGQIRINPQGRNAALRGANVDRVSNDLMIKLSQFPEFDVMERNEIDQVIDEKAFSTMARGSSTRGAIGELEGADYLVIAVIDDLLIRTERKKVPYVNELQIRYFGTVESTLRMVDVHSGRLVGADKIRLKERIRDTDDEREAVADLLDLYSSELVHRISENLKARQRGDDLRPQRPVLDAQRPKLPVPKFNRPNF